MSGTGAAQRPNRKAERISGKILAQGRTETQSGKSNWKVESINGKIFGARVRDTPLLPSNRKVERISGKILAHVLLTRCGFWLLAALLKGLVAQDFATRFRLGQSPLLSHRASPWGLIPSQVLRARSRIWWAIGPLGPQRRPTGI